MPARYPDFNPRLNAWPRGYSASRPASLERSFLPHVVRQSRTDSSVQTFGLRLVMIKDMWPSLAK